jgi:hypothetical protein
MTHVGKVKKSRKRGDGRQRKNKLTLFLPTWRIW